MGLYIKGLTAPKFGFKELRIYVNSQGKLYALEKQIDNSMKKYEVTEIKVPHDKLISNDFLVMYGDEERYENGDTFDSGVEFMLFFIDGLPAVIEAESEHENIKKEVV